MVPTSFVQSDVDWFDVGWMAYAEGLRGADAFPPLNDIEAQRWWLGGFGTAWAEGFDVGESVDEALARMLAGREELLRQLRSHKEGWGSRWVQ
jgi:hypothetical protein